LLVNVLKKEVVFAEGIPIIKVCVAGGDVEPAIVRSAREKGKPGRKRYATKEEDEQLRRQEGRNLEERNKYMGEKLKQTLNCA